MASCFLVGGVTMLIAVACTTPATDPGHPDRFFGVARGDDRNIVLYIIDCRGGDLRSLRVSPYDPATERRATAVWEIGSSQPSSPRMIPEEDLVEIVIGDLPSGTTTVTPLDRDRLESSETLEVNVETTANEYGFFFSPRDVVVGEIWTQSDRPRESRTEFARSARDCPKD